MPQPLKPLINKFGQVENGVYTYEKAVKDKESCKEKKEKVLLITQTVIATLNAREAEIRNNPYVGNNSTKNFAAIGIRYRNRSDSADDKYKFFTAFSQKNQLSRNHGERLAWENAEQWLQEKKDIDVRHIAIHTERSPCNRPLDDKSGTEYCAEFFTEKFREQWLKEIPIDLTYVVDRKLNNNTNDTKFKTSDVIALELKSHLSKVGVKVDPPTPRSALTTSAAPHNSYTERLKTIGKELEKPQEHKDDLTRQELDSQKRERYEPEKHEHPGPKKPKH